MITGLKLMKVDRMELNQVIMSPIWEQLKDAWIRGDLFMLKVHMTEVEKILENLKLAVKDDLYNNLGAEK